jgi:hypothetical protein
MSSDLHAVKLAATQATLQSYGLEKLSINWGAGVKRLFTWKPIGEAPALAQNLGRNALVRGGLSAAAGAIAGGARGYYQGGQPRADGSQPTAEERMAEAKRQALIGGATAGGIGAAASTLHGMRPQLGWLGRASKEIGRDAIFGSPVNLWEKIKRHQERAGGSLLKGVGSVARDWYWFTPDKLDLKHPATYANLAAQGYGLYHPIKELYQGATSENKDERLGNVVSGVTGLALAPFTTRLGLMGLPLQTAIQSGARRLVEGKSHPTNFEYDPAAHAAHITGGLRGLRGEINVPIEGLSALESGQ